jgi:hypothetical protein
MFVAATQRSQDIESFDEQSWTDQGCGFRPREKVWRSARRDDTVGSDVVVQVSIRISERDMPSRSHTTLCSQESRVTAWSKRLQHSSRHVERRMHLCRTDAETAFIPRERRD